MTPYLLLTTLFGIALVTRPACAEEITTAAGKVGTGAPILCGVSPKSKDLISASVALSKEVEYLDLLLKSLSPRQNKKLEKIINQGSIEELIKIDGIAEGRAKTIIKSRPYREVKELMLIQGFGYATVASVIMHGSNLKP